MKFNDGFFYKGYFLQNDIIGKGCLYGLSNNKIYEGKWINSVFHGNGTLYHETGNKFYIGKFNNGKCHGKGKIYSVHGKKLYEGGFRNGMMINQNLEDYNKIIDLMHNFNNNIHYGCFEICCDYVDVYECENNNQIKEYIPSAPAITEI